MPAGSERCADLAGALGFGGPHFASTSCVLVAAFLVFRFRNDTGDGDGPSLAVDGDVGEVGGGDMPGGPAGGVLDHGTDTDLHAGAEGSVDAGLEDQQVANVNGSDEVEVVHGCRDDDGAGVAPCGDSSNEVDELHQATAKEVAEGIGVGREYDLAALCLAGGDCS